MKPHAGQTVNQQYRQPREQGTQTLPHPVQALTGGGVRLGQKLIKGFPCSSSPEVRGAESPQQELARAAESGLVRSEEHSPALAPSAG